MANTAHLVGSVPLRDAETVFRTVSGTLGPYLKRVTDGETGERQRWIWFQREMLANHPAMELADDESPFALYQWDGQLIRETPYIRFRPGVDPSKVTFETGYAAAALESFALYSPFKDEGVIGSRVRFQVSLPTPMATAYMYISPDSRDAYLPAYEKALTGALAEIVDSVPHDALAIQWDVCQEVLIFEDYFSHRPGDYKAQVFAELARLGDCVPASVDLGYHLCYGSPRDEHLVMPADAGVLVEIDNGVVSSQGRGLDFLHLPTPKDRTDPEYFQPLRELRLPAETELIMGLVHFDDEAGDLARMDAAKNVLDFSGVATECGWG